MIVVDASIAVLWTQEPHQDPRAKAAQDLASALIRETILVPPIFAYEVANVIHHKNRFRTLPIRRAKTEALLQMVKEADQSVLDVGPLAEQHRLSVYDAAYLELAQRRAATLVTEDARLHAAGVKALGRDRCLRLRDAVTKWK